MSSLTSLNLANNKLMHVNRRWWHGLSTKLTYLSLSNNGLSGELAGGAFSTLGSLTTLDLSHNRIRSLHHECFQGTRTQLTHSLTLSLSLGGGGGGQQAPSVMRDDTSRVEQAADSQPGQQRDQAGGQAFVALGLAWNTARSRPR
jgi:hypothetical protein